MTGDEPPPSPPGRPFPANRQGLRPVLHPRQITATIPAIPANSFSDVRGLEFRVESLSLRQNLGWLSDPGALNAVPWGSRMGKPKYRASPTKVHHARRTPAWRDFPIKEEALTKPPEVDASTLVWHVLYVMPKAERSVLHWLERYARWPTCRSSGDGR